MTTAPHAPVLLPEVLSALPVSAGDVVVDATFGAGGYSQAFLNAGATVVAIDRDPLAAEIAKERFVDAAGAGRFRFVPSTFDALADAVTPAEHSKIKAIVADIGVSSMQLDQAPRGFSFQRPGPLDMRMGGGATAADVLAQVDEADLARIFWQYGEERRSRQLAKAIITARDNGAPITTTEALAKLAEQIVGKAQKTNPSTRLFQALRIFVNDELGQLVRFLMAAEQLLVEGARLACVTFHSLEDRIVKRFFARAAAPGPRPSKYAPPAEGGPAPSFGSPAKPVTASASELDANPRARSATLRVATRTSAPPLNWSDDDLTKLGLPGIALSPLQERWRSS